MSMSRIGNSVRYITRAIICLIAAAPALAQAADGKPTVFTNVNVFDSANAKLLKNMSVVVEGDHIKSVEQGAIKAPEGAKIIDGGGGTLIPGLIDNHMHIFMSASTRAELEAAKDPAKLHANAEAEAKAILMRGFTAVRDVGGPVFGLKRKIDKGEVQGPRIYPSGGLISQTSGHGDFRTPQERSRRWGGQVSAGELLGVGFIADGRDEVLTATRENLRAGATQIKVMAGGGAASAYDPLDVAQYTLDELKAAVEAADDWNTYVTVHAYTPKAVKRAIEAGVKCIEHGQLLDEESVQLIAKKGVWLSLQALDPAPEGADPNVKAKKATVVKGTDNAFVWAKKHAVKLGFGTDIMFMPDQNKNQSTDMVKLKQWFTPAEALRIITYNNGQLLALSGPRNPYGKLGIIEKDAMADMILVDGDPTVNLDLIGNPDKNFKIIMKNGQVVKGPGT